MGYGLGRQVLFIVAIPIWIVIRIVLFFFKKMRRIKFALKREIIINIFFIYILCVLSLTLFPLYVQFGSNKDLSSLNLIPIVGTLKDISKTTGVWNMHNSMAKFWIKNVFGNMFLLFPLGVMLPMLWKKFQRNTKVILVAFCSSISIETLQLLSGYIGNSGRAFDVDDIILNTLGALIGIVFYKKFIKGIMDKNN